MHQINSNGHDWLIVPVQNSIRDIDVWDGDALVFVHSNTGTPDYIDLPEGEWQIHSDTSTITEQQAAEIVTNEGKTVASYVDYSDPFKGHETALQSLQSLLTSLGITGRAVILKKS